MKTWFREVLPAVGLCALGFMGAHQIERIVPGSSGTPALACSPDQKHTAEQCPDLDDDGDNVRNGVDLCPHAMGLLELHGCPRQHQEEEVEGLKVSPEPAVEARSQEPSALDRDGDGLANRFDVCPNVFGREDNDGCPEDGLPWVSISRARLELRGRIFFVPGEAVLEARSHLLLDWVAKVINEHPEFPGVLVAVHTNNRRSSESSLKLSREQALSVRHYLVQHGVAPERLKAQGYGDTRPIDTSRENNRRVDFYILWPD